MLQGNRTKPFQGILHTANCNPTNSNDCYSDKNPHKKVQACWNFQDKLILQKANISEEEAFFISLRRDAQSKSSHNLILQSLLSYSKTSTTQDGSFVHHQQSYRTITKGCIPSTSSIHLIMETEPGNSSQLEDINCNSECPNLPKMISFFNHINSLGDIKKNFQPINEVLNKTILELQTSESYFVCASGKW